MPKRKEEKFMETPVEYETTSEVPTVPVEGVLPAESATPSAEVLPVEDPVEAVLVMDQAVVERWLRDGSARKYKKFDRVEFMPDDLPYRQLDLALELALRAVKPGGCLVVPVTFGYLPLLSGLQVIKTGKATVTFKVA